MNLPEVKQVALINHRSEHRGYTLYDDVVLKYGEDNVVLINFSVDLMASTAFNDLDPAVEHGNHPNTMTIDSKHMFGGVTSYPGTYDIIKYAVASTHPKVERIIHIIYKDDYVRFQVYLNHYDEYQQEFNIPEFNDEVSKLGASSTDYKYWATSHKNLTTYTKEEIVDILNEDSYMFSPYRDVFIKDI